ncbi:MAG: lysophospholipid acyltransferase family protein [Bacteroidia bacterium]|jgi:putative hemolysin|nr:lysophospholipid acyltransferase family protein [Bacteroidia bacterium]
MADEELISDDAIAKGLKLQKIKLKALAPFISKALKLNQINKVYAHAAEETGTAFIDDVLEQLQVSYEFNADELQHIPKTEPFIVIANHPYGGIDGLILLRLIAQARPDFKVMANFLLQQIPQLKDYFVGVNPFENNAGGMNISGIKRCMKLLNDGNPIGIFPAGEVSALKLNNLKISDKMWSPVVGKMIMKAGVKVVPVYFSGHNSLGFNLLGLVHPMLRTAKLPSELLNKKNEKISIRIGKAVSVKTLQEFNDSNELLRFLRAKTYALGSSLDVEPTYFSKLLKKPAQPEEIISETPTHLILEDVNRIDKRDLLFTHDTWKIYLSSAKFIPNVLREISRLREITFREVGEGTNHSSDTDEYDLHYKHLFIWDSENQKIVGSYRIGLGDVLFRKYKKQGFYLNELFRIGKEFNPILKQSLELGRSFVAKDYQRKPYSLMLLWKGVNEFLRKENYRYKYLIGPVSISNSFSALSKDLLVDFITKHHFDNKLAQYVKPRKRYKYQYKGEGELLKQMQVDDIKVLDNMIAEIEKSQNKIPVLLKKYLKQNAKIIAFNVDPAFNNALDGFLVMNLSEVPDDTFDMVMR